MVASNEEVVSLGVHWSNPTPLLIIIFGNVNELFQTVRLNTFSQENALYIIYYVRLNNFR